MKIWIGVFAMANGWRLVGPLAQERYLDRNETIGAAIRLAPVAEWRGQAAGILAQANAWGALSAVELRSWSNRLRRFS